MNWKNSGFNGVYPENSGVNRVELGKGSVNCVYPEK